MANDVKVLFGLDLGQARLYPQRGPHAQRCFCLAAVRLGDREGVFGAEEGSAAATVEIPGRDVHLAKGLTDRGDSRVQRAPASRFSFITQNRNGWGNYQAAGERLSLARRSLQG